jgi:DNA-directed RNA polymerase subunit alpha
VRYKVEHTRVGQVTDLDKLALDITTDGTVSPAEALKQAAGILTSQFSVIAGDQAPARPAAAVEEGTEDSDPNELNFSIDDLNLSPRTSNALMNNDITTVRQLVEVSDAQLRELKGFGAKAYQEVVSKLKELELR